jgi:hypothetical protein
MKNTFDISEIYWSGWELFKKHWESLVGALLLTLLVTYSIEGIVYGLEYPYYGWAGYQRDIAFRDIPFLTMLLITLFKVVSFVASLFMSYNLQKIYLNVVKGHSVKAYDVFNAVDNNIFYYFLGAIAYGLVVVFSFGILAVPAVFFYYFAGKMLYGVVIVGLAAVLSVILGIYVTLRFMFVPYLILDKKVDVAEAFVKSGEMTDGIKWHLIGYGLVGFGIFLLALIAGLICLIIGIFPAMIICCLVMQLSFFVLYKKLV